MRHTVDYTPWTPIRRAVGVAPDLKTAGFSMRECAKQLTLLEDHLAHAHKACGDCIHKHALTAEAFADEALTLDGARRFPGLPGLGLRVRGCRTHGDVRELRKQLTSDLRAEGLGRLGQAPAGGGPSPGLVVGIAKALVQAGGAIVQTFIGTGAAKKIAGIEARAGITIAEIQMRGAAFAQQIGLEYAQLERLQRQKQLETVLGHPITWAFLAVVAVKVLR